MEYKDELFPFSTLERAIDTILAKYPESIKRDKHTDNMTEFCKSYVNMLLSSVSERSFNSHSKSNSELFSIVIGGRVSTQKMYNNEQLNKLKIDPIYIKVYSFVRDNIEKFIE